MELPPPRYFGNRIDVVRLTFVIGIIYVAFFSSTICACAWLESQNTVDPTPVKFGVHSFRQTTTEDPSSSVPGNRLIRSTAAVVILVSLANLIAAGVLIHGTRLKEKFHVLPSIVVHLVNLALWFFTVLIVLIIMPAFQIHAEFWHTSVGIEMVLLFVWLTAFEFIDVYFLRCLWKCFCYLRKREKFVEKNRNQKATSGDFVALIDDEELQQFASE